MPAGVVVGAGVIGASVAWHLARQGLRALVLEREASPGQGSTGRATGGFRAQYGTAINVPLSLLPREKARRVEAGHGGDPGAVLGRAPECENLFLCNGSSGHESCTRRPSDSCWRRSSCTAR